MSRKAQAAMEFLMTYGWAILVVLAAIGALAYFGVLSPGNFMPDKCDIPAGLDCVEKPVVSTTDVQFKVTNNMGTNITVTQFFADTTGDCTADEDIADIEIQDGESQILTYAGGSFTSGKRVKCKFNIEYFQGTGGLAHRIGAYVVGKVS